MVLISVKALRFKKAYEWFRDVFVVVQQSWTEWQLVHETGRLREEHASPDHVRQSAAGAGRQSPPLALLQTLGLRVARLGRARPPAHADPLRAPCCDDVVAVPARVEGHTGRRRRPLRRVAHVWRVIAVHVQPVGSAIGVLKERSLWDGDADVLVTTAVDVEALSREKRDAATVTQIDGVYSPPVVEPLSPQARPAILGEVCESAAIGHASLAAESRSDRLVELCDGAGAGCQSGQRRQQVGVGSGTLWADGEPRERRPQSGGGGSYRLGPVRPDLLPNETDQHRQQRQPQQPPQGTPQQHRDGDPADLDPAVLDPAVLDPAVLDRAVLDPAVSTLLSLTLPSLTVPSLTLLSLTLLSLTLPSLTVLSLTLLSLTLPSLTLLSLTLPSLTVPSLTLPSLDPADRDDSGVVEAQESGHPSRSGPGPAMVISGPDERNVNVAVLYGRMSGECCQSLVV